jgi:hypothetical protein
MRHMPICESTAITCSTSIKKAKLSPRALFPNDENIEPIAIYTAETLAPEEQILTPPTELCKTVSVAERVKFTFALAVSNCRCCKQLLLLIALFVVIVQEYHYLSWLNILYLFANCQSLNTTFHVQRQKQFYTVQ